MSVNNSFVLPDTLPQLPVPKTGKPVDKSKYAKEKIESAANAILNNQACSDPLPLVRFFKILARDQDWMQANKDIANKTLTAITKLYFHASEKPVALKANEKIKRTVQDKHVNLAPFALCDVDVKLPDSSSLPCASLFLACQSPMFDNQLKSGLKEGLALRNYLNRSPSDNCKPPELHLHTTLKIASLYLDLMTKGSDVPVLSSLEEQDMVNLVDMTDSYQALYPRMKSVFLKHLDQNNLPRLWELVLKECKAKYAARPDKPAQEILDEAQQVLASLVRPENALMMYRFAKINSLPILGRSCLEKLLSGMTLDVAYHGVITKQIDLEEPVSVNHSVMHQISGDDVKAYCLNWFVEQLPQAFANIRHDISSIESTGSLLLHKIGGNLRINHSRTYNDAHLFFSRFKEAAKHFETFGHSALQSLSAPELNWVIKQLPKTIHTFDLSNCQLDTGEPFKGFIHVKSLKLCHVASLTNMVHIYDMENLEILDLTGCQNLEKLDPTMFSQLKVLRIGGCNNINPLLMTTTALSPHLTQVIIPSHLESHFKRTWPTQEVKVL